LPKRIIKRAIDRMKRPEFGPRRKVGMEAPNRRSVLIMAQKQKDTGPGNLT
jgi:hypothetical protein